MRSPIITLGFVSFLAAVLWMNTTAQAPKEASLLTSSLPLLSAESAQNGAQNGAQSAAQNAAQMAAQTTRSAVDGSKQNPPSTQTAVARSQSVSSVKQMPERIITDFTQAAIEAEQWRNVDDTVMGGISQGEIVVTAESTGVFSGTLSLENNGGFSSVRRDTSGYDFSGVEALSVRIKGDGRRYQLRVQTRDADRVTYRAEFSTTTDQWQTITVPIERFEPVFRGRIIESAPPLSADGIYQIGFLIADKRSGDFRLEVDWIGAE